VVATRRDLSDGATTVCLTRRQHPEELPHLSTIRLHLYMSLSNFAVDHTRAALRERSEGATIPSLFGRQHLDMLPKVFTTVSKLIMSRKQQFDALRKLFTSGFKLIMSLSNFVVDHTEQRADLVHVDMRARCWYTQHRPIAVLRRVIIHLI
jgi:hypothetical protein